MGLTSPGSGGVGEPGDLVGHDRLTVFHFVEDVDVSRGSRRLSNGVEREGCWPAFGGFCDLLKDGL